MKVAFLVNDLELSGGVGVVIEHARQLSAMADFDVTLVLVREQEGASWHGYEHLPHLYVRSREQALHERYDVAIATWWETAFTLFELRAERYACFVQSLEDRFYRRDEAERFGAGLVLDLPVTFITEARWIADTIAALRPDAPCHLVRNGIDKEVFAPVPRVHPRLHGPLRVLIEGSPSSWFKHVYGAIDAACAMREPRRLVVVTGEREALARRLAERDAPGELRVDELLGPLSHREMADLYADTDVVLKLSSVEGMFGPPLEGFHKGATCVVTPVTGYDEYVQHGFNALVTDWDDLLGTARQLDLLARNRGLLQFLRTNALETARAWPSWLQASQFMAGVLLTIAREPQPSDPRGSAALLADVRLGLEIHHRHLLERARFADRALRLERILLRLRGNALVRFALSLRRYRVVQVLARPLRPLTRPIKRLVA